MPSAFDAEFLTDASPDLLAAFGEAITLIAASGQEFTLSAIVAHDPAPLEDNRSNKRRVEKCLVWGMAAERECGDAVAFEHADGPIVIETRLAMLLQGDGDQKWDFKEQAGRSGGMVGCRFERPVVEETGDLTPGIGR